MFTRERGSLNLIVALYWGQLVSGPHVAHGHDLASSFLIHHRCFSPLSLGLHLLLLRHKMPRDLLNSWAIAQQAEPVGGWGVPEFAPAPWLVSTCRSPVGTAGAATAVLGSGFLGTVRLAGVVQPGGTGVLVGSVRDSVCHGANEPAEKCSHFHVPVDCRGNSGSALQDDVLWDGALSGKWRLTWKRLPLWALPSFLPYPLLSFLLLPRNCSAQESISL